MMGNVGEGAQIKVWRDGIWTGPAPTPAISPSAYLSIQRCTTLSFIFILQAITTCLPPTTLRKCSPQGQPPGGTPCPSSRCCCLSDTEPSWLGPFWVSFLPGFCDSSISLFPTNLKPISLGSFCLPFTLPLWVVFTTVPSAAHSSSLYALTRWPHPGSWLH